MAGTKVTIALATYNGGKFLPAFLASIDQQTHRPCELVVCDDGSSDGSLEVLNEYSREASFPVRILAAHGHRGVVGNFSRAIAASRGEWIALADQDDVWRPIKLERLVQEAANPTVMAIFSDAEVVDEHRDPLGYTMWEQIGFGGRRRAQCLEDRPWEALFKDPVVSGATMVFRRELAPLIFPIPDFWMHDAWIAQISASQGQLVAVPTPLIEYRQHNSNVIGGRKVPLFGQVRRAGSIGRLGLVERELRRYEELRDRLATFPATTRRDRMLTLCDAKLNHLLRRSRVPSARIRRVPSVLREWLNGNYARFAKDWRNIAADLLMP